jgi:molybdate-binding protein/DNA-binding XRE family transcriptional regulator
MKSIGTILENVDTIMAQTPSIENDLREHRARRGWSQEELARRAGLSRAGISSIETERLVPSAAAALALAAAFECRVEDLFHLRRQPSTQPEWAWPSNLEPCRYWAAEVDGVDRLYPTEPTAIGMIPHDGVSRPGASGEKAPIDPRRTLVMACCDPAVGLLAAALAAPAGIRLLPLQRPSREALELVGRGLVHVAGVHLSPASEPGGNARVVSEKLGAGYCLLRVARWEEGVALSPACRVRSIRSAVRSKLRWIGREEGSGARQCLDELLGSKQQAPSCLASHHRAVAEAVRSGWAEAGVCLRLASEEAGLTFFGLREEAYDLCFPIRLAGDHRIQALQETVRSPLYRKALSELPGYDSSETGELQQVT